MVSGNAQIDHVAHVKNNFLAGKTGLAAFSPGCGGGGNEMSWARTGLFRRIDACDLRSRASPPPDGPPNKRAWTGS